MSTKVSTGFQWKYKYTIILSRNHSMVGTASERWYCIEFFSMDKYSLRPVAYNKREWYLEPPSAQNWIMYAPRPSPRSDLTGCLSGAKFQKLIKNKVHCITVHCAVYDKLPICLKGGTFWNLMVILCIFYSIFPVLLHVTSLSNTAISCDWVNNLFTH